MIELVLDEHDVLRYNRKGNHHIIRVSDMDRAKLVFRPNCRHPFIAAFVVILLAGYLVYWGIHFGFNLAGMFMTRGGHVLMVAFVLVYFLGILLHLKNIYWLEIRKKDGHQLLLPLDDYPTQLAKELIVRIHFKMQLN